MSARVSGGLLEIHHLAGVTAIQPLAKPAKLRQLRRRRDAAEIEAQLPRPRLDCVSGQHVWRD